ncbi:MAG: translational GTPase TypA [Deltaproteobacteria bacterium]|nr:MAG: translational GTPase TypA [Deltaproteobacteria bacterium]
MDFRNIAIIAHVDHGKTTLVDGLLRQCHAFQDHEAVQDRVMDSMDLERERGITITAKNTAVFYQDAKINIVDTPGHADFGGEVERVLTMVDGALLLVDASEGPLPQTRYVLGKAMAAGLTLMVVINKIDRPDARTEEVLQEVYDLFIDLDAEEDQLDFPVLYACARDGFAKHALDDEDVDLRPLLDAIVEHIPPPSDVQGEHATLMVTNLDYDPYVGRLCLGRLQGGPLKKNEASTWFGLEKQKMVRPQLMYSWRGLKRYEVDVAEPGDIIAIAGVPEITVGDTLTTAPEPKPLPRLRVDEPTIGMRFGINTSPLSGRDGKYLTSRQVRDRLDRELLANVSLKVEDADDGSEALMVYGRGELQLAILIEQMRREGFELTIGRPRVVKREVDGELQEPWEQAFLDVPDDAVGSVTQKLAARKGQMLDMRTDGSGRTRLTYRIPSRGLIGYRSELLTDSRGEGLLNTMFDGWDADVGFIQGRLNGTLISDRAGKATTYALYNLLPRGEMFIIPGEEVYEGMIVGIHKRENDLNVNVVRAKQLTNVRSAGADEKQLLPPPRELTLESAMEFIDDDECIEITPSAIRLRKTVLKGNERTIVRGEKATKA